MRNSSKKSKLSPPRLVCCAAQGLCIIRRLNCFPENKFPWRGKMENCYLPTTITIRTIYGICYLPTSIACHCFIAIYHILNALPDNSSSGTYSVSFPGKKRSFAFFISHFATEVRELMILHTLYLVRN